VNSELIRLNLPSDLTNKLKGAKSSIMYEGGKKCVENFNWKV